MVWESQFNRGKISQSYRAREIARMALFMAQALENDSIIQAIYMHIQ